MMGILSSERFTPLQKQELQEASSAGLDSEAMRLLRNPAFNYLQMRALRTALQEGMAKETVSRFAGPWIPADEMREIAEAFRNGETPAIPKRPLRLKRFLIPFACMSAAAALATVLVLSGEETGELSLTAKEIRLSCGMEFTPEAYVREVKGENAELILPEGFVAEVPEVRIAAYELRTASSSQKKLLRIIIRDETPPTLTLLQNHIELLRVTPFSCHAYVGSARDAIDGDLTEQVHCSDVLSEEETQTVIYSVTDRSGNEAEAALEVHFADAEPVSSESAAETAVPMPPPAVPAPLEPVSEPVVSLPEYSERVEIVEYSEFQEAASDHTVVEHHT